MPEYEAKHPDYDDRKPEWDLMRHCVRGETEIKRKGADYLPIPDGFTADAAHLYDSYKLRAQFPDITDPTIREMVGLIHRTETQIENLPERMMPLWETATKDGLPLEAFHRRITTELLTTARFSLLVDAAREGSDLPFMVGYTAESLINWSPNRDLFVLDESGYGLSGYNWNNVKRHRVLRLNDDGFYEQEFYSSNSDEEEEEAERIEPQARGARRLETIPFVVIGARDLSLDVETPPLIGVARAALAAYRLDADYRWQMYRSGQETLVVINGKAPDMLGASIVIELEGEHGKTPDAKYIAPSGRTIEAHRKAIQDEREHAVMSGARLFDDQNRGQESGEAKRLRYAAQTATLNTIAQASAAGLERALRFIALMMGIDESTARNIVVKPNTKFVDTALSPDGIKKLVEGWQAGGYSYDTLWTNLQRGEFASPERTADEERALIETEDTTQDLVDDAFGDDRSENDDSGSADLTSAIEALRSQVEDDERTGGVRARI